jgi:hypothetical protein
MSVMGSRTWWLGGVAAIVLLPFVVALAMNPDPEFIFYAAAMIAEVAAVIWMDARVRFSWWALGGLAAWAVLHMAGGIVPIPESLTEPGRPTNLYNMRVHPNLPKYDQVVHAFGFGVATLTAWEALRAMARGVSAELPRGVGLFALLVCVGCELGAINEVIEFIATRLMPHTNVGGYDNTGWDLVANLVGSMSVAAAVCYWPTRRGTEV